MARPKNPNTKPRKEATGRKYFVLDAAPYREFIENQGITPYESKEAALRAADEMAKAADESEPGVKHEFAIFEEAGFLATEVVKKVNRGFSTSRTVTRTPKAENAASEEANPTETESQDSEVSAESTSSNRKRRH